MREKFIELLAQAIFYAEKTNVDNAIKFTFAAVVDWLMANGVTIPVRCKDCSKRLTEDCALFYGRMNDRYFWIDRGEDFSCGWGERRTDD